LKLETEDSAIFVTERATAARIEGNRLQDNLIGVYLKGAPDALVKDNIITGRQDLRMNERGNAVQIWNAPGALVEGNDIRYGRDGIFVTTSKNDVFRNNRFRDLRFGIHYMYTNLSEISGNHSIGNHGSCTPTA
jgi:nitrous oxidase accessory protein